MGKVLSLMGRPFRNYNLESRAHKIIAKDKQMPAPKYASDQLSYEQMMKDYPEAYEEGQQKNKKLDQFLKDIYVQSHDPALEYKSGQNPEKPLPMSREQVQDFEYGIKEPEKIPQGKTTLKRALQFITEHHSDPKIHSADKISKDNVIPKETIENILKHYNVFEVYLPEQRKVKAKFAGPTVPRIRIVPNIPKQLPTKEKDET